MDADESGDEKDEEDDEDRYFTLKFVFNFDVFQFTIIFSEDEDEDDTAELLAELERIKKERAEEQLKKVLGKT